MPAPTTPPSAVPAGSRPGSAGLSAIVATTAVAVGALVLLVAVWAASAGPRPAIHLPNEPDVPASYVPNTTSTPKPTTTTTKVGPRQHRPQAIITAIGLVVLLVGLATGALVLYLLWQALRSLGPALRRRRTPPEPEPPPLEAGQRVVAVARTMAADAEEQVALLEEGSPRNAIVECWHRFEVQAAQAGLPRAEWETSAEFTLRVLDLVEADTTSVERLSALYREARFSEHEVTEDDRTAAREAVAVLHRDLRTLAGGDR